MGCANARDLPAPHLGGGYCCLPAHTLSVRLLLVGVGMCGTRRKWSGVVASVAQDCKVCCGSAPSDIWLAGWVGSTRGCCELLPMVAAVGWTEAAACISSSQRWHRLYGVCGPWHRPKATFERAALASMLLLQAHTPQSPGVCRVLCQHTRDTDLGLSGGRCVV